jgi:hypothetical protein
MKLREKLLSASSEVLKQITLPLKLKQDKHLLNGWILDREQEASELEVKIQELKASEKLNPVDILKAMDALDITKDNIQRGRELFKELFETDVIKE